jgi:hypothetical protein
MTRFIERNFAAVLGAVIVVTFIVASVIATGR